MNKTNKSFIQSTFYYHPFFSNSTYSELNSHQINSIQTLQQQQDNEQDQQPTAQLQQSSNQVEDQENQQYDENANLRLLMDVAVGLWEEEQQRNFDFRN